MKAIFSLCTKFLDVQNAHGGFPDAETFGCSCVLSVLLAKRQFGRVELYTDTRGARLLERLHLPFDAVHLVFDDFPYPHHLWAAAKLQVYRRQTEPFAHIDLDAYLWAPLPPRLAGAGFLAQSSEDDYTLYEPPLDFLLRRAGYLPDFIRRHADRYGLRVRALNAGIYGGHDLATIHACCEAALTTLDHPANQPMFEELAREHAHPGGLFYHFNIVLEQLYPSVYCHEHGLPISYLLDAAGAPTFTHLLGDAKRHPINVRNLRARVARDYPTHYQLARQLAAHPVAA